ncbi:MAG: hypothetical protein OXF20_07405 [Gammaproteobacteria bacterium]|nr:hypothetical protein [Gammaproteobacteria bacterium]
MLAAHENRNIRVRRKACSQVKAFFDSACTDRQAVLAASGKDPEPRTVRLVKCPGSDWVLMTTLLGGKAYTPQQLADLSCIAVSMYRERIGRSFRRISQKPVGKWKPGKA